MYTGKSQRVAVSALVGSMASAAFSWGATVGDGIPSPNAVYQWYGFCPDGNTMRLNVLYRNYNPAAGDASGPFFAESKFTVEAGIRRCLNVASQISVQTLAKKYNDRLKDLFRKKIEEREKSNSKDFIALFEAMYESGDDVGGGFTLLEPFANHAMDPPLRIEGCTFANQGSHAQKRLRIMAESDDGHLVPIQLLVGPRRALGAQGAAPMANPWTDIRLLAGTVAVGSPKLYYLLLQFINQIIPDVKILTLRDPNVSDLFTSQIATGSRDLYHAFAGAPNDVVPGAGNYLTGNQQVNGGFQCDTMVNDNGIAAVFPTIFSYHDIEAIRDIIHQGMADHEGNPLAFLPFYGDRIIRFIRDKIRERLDATTDDKQIAPLASLFEFDQRVVGEIGSANRQGSGANNYQHHGFYMAHRRWTHIPGSPQIAGGGAAAQNAENFNRWPQYDPVPGRTVERGGYNPEEVQIHRQKYDEMRRELQKLKRDPVLWINGPRLNPRQGVEVLGGNIQPAWIGWQTAPPDMRPTILPGFDPKSLKSYCHDTNDGVSGAYHLERQPGGAPGQLATHYFSTDSTINSRIIDPTTTAPAPALGRAGFHTDGDYAGGLDQYRRRDPDGRPRHGTNAYYTNYSDPMRNLINSINTVYNIVSTPGVATRLSDWKDALGIKDEIDAIPDEARDTDEPAVRLAEPPYHSMIEIPDNETRFRLGLMDPPRAMDAAAAEELDFDAEFKQFEYDMHVGDTDAYTQEVLTVIRLALESILVPTTDVGIDDEDTDLLAMYNDTAELHDRVIPVMTPPSTTDDQLNIQGTDRITGGWSTGFKNRLTIRQNRRANFGRIPRVFRLEPDKYIMSACSQFVYRHVVTHATAPFARESGRHPNYRETAAMLSSLNPFPLRDGNNRAFILAALERCKDRIRADFSNGYHLVQHMDHTRPSEIHQPYTPLLVSFARTSSNDGNLRWSVGSESTWMLEGIVLALHLINAIAKEGGVAVPAERVDLDLVPPMVFDITQPATSAKYEALRRMSVEPTKSMVQTHSFMTLKRDMVYNADQYAAWLGVVDGRRLNQAGRYHMGSDNRGDKPVGNFASSGERTIPFNHVAFEDIRATRTVRDHPNIRRNDIQLAIDAATTNRVYGKLEPGAAITENNWYDGLWQEIYTDMYAAGNGHETTELWNTGGNESTQLRREIRLLSTIGVVLAAYQWYRREYNSNQQHGRAANIGGGGNPFPIVGVLVRVTREVATNGGGPWIIPQTRMYNRTTNLTPETDPIGGVTYFVNLEIESNVVSDDLFGPGAIIPDEEGFTRLVSRMIRYAAELFHLKPSMHGFPVPVQGIRYAGNFHPGFPTMGIYTESDETTYTLAKPQPQYTAEYDPVNYDDAFSQQLSRMHTGNEASRTYEFHANKNGYRQAGPHHYYEGQHIAIPLWEAENDYTATTRLVGYAIFERLRCTVAATGGDNSPRRITFDWYGSRIQDVAVYDSTQMVRLGENKGRAMYGFNTNIVCGLLIDPADRGAGVTPLLRMTRGYPFWSVNLDDDDILRRTAAIKLDKAEEKLPYEFTAVQVPLPGGPNQDEYDRPHADGDYGEGITVDALVDRLMGSFNGLHFSNSHSLHSTVMAMATGENRAKIHEFLNRETKVYKRPIPWTTSVEHGDPAYRGDAILLEMLYSDFEASSSRATDTPMSSRVLVRSKGPGPADKATPTYVDTYFYRTDTFYRIEVKAMEVFKDIVIKTTRPPGGSVANPLGGMFHRIGTLHDMLRLRPEAASAVAKFMINLYKFEKIAHRSNQPRDKAAVNIQSRTITIDANHILYRI